MVLRTINDDGTYSNTTNWSLIVDGLSSTASGGGFSENTTGKYTLLTIIKGLSSRVYSMSIGAKARINKLYSKPSINSLCSLNTLKISGSVDTADILNDSDYGALTGNLLICGNGGGDSIHGTAARDIIEAGDQGASSLIGAGGHDHLRGTADNDTISGGDGDDVLVGGDGDDLLEGGSGDNMYRPGEGNDSITGGINLDIVFIDGDINEYHLEFRRRNVQSRKPPSRKRAISITQNNTGGEVIISMMPDWI